MNKKNNITKISHTILKECSMTDTEIIKLWKQGLSKNQLSLTYKRRYNQKVKIIRAEMKNRHKGRFITNYEALAYIERVIYNELKRK